MGLSIASSFSKNGESCPTRSRFNELYARLVEGGRHAGQLPLATAHGLFHIAIKTSDLAATRSFWADIIGLRDMNRPDFDYPGARLACPQPGGLGIIHIYAGGPALGPGGKVLSGAAAIVHVSQLCSGYRSYVSTTSRSKRCSAARRSPVKRRNFLALYKERRSITRQWRSAADRHIVRRNIGIQMNNPDVLWE